MQRYTRAELIDFISENFNNFDELRTALTRYKQGGRFTTLPEIDKVIFNNLSALMSISSEIGSGQLDLFGDGESYDDLMFWVKSNFKDPSKLKELLDDPDKVKDTKDYYKIVHNYDELESIYNDLISPSNSSPQIEEAKQENSEYRMDEQQLRDWITTNFANLDEFRSILKIYQDGGAIRDKRNMVFKANIDLLSQIEAEIQQSDIDTIPKLEAAINSELAGMSGIDNQAIKLFSGKTEQIYRKLRKCFSEGNQYKDGNIIKLVLPMYTNLLVLTDNENLIDSENLVLVNQDDNKILGREYHPHITFLTDVPDDKLQGVIDDIKSRLPVLCGIVGVSRFETNDSYDVIKFDVISDELTYMYNYIVDKYKLETKHEFKPHITLAYVKKGSNPIDYNDTVSNSDAFYCDCFKLTTNKIIS